MMESVDGGVSVLADLDTGGGSGDWRVSALRK